MNHPHNLLSGTIDSDTADLILSALVFGGITVGMMLLTDKIKPREPRWPRPGHTVRDLTLGWLGGAGGYLVAQLFLNQAGC